MENLRLHLGGKEDSLKELEIEYSQKIKEIEYNDKLTSKEKRQAVEKTKREHQKLKNQSNYNLF